MKNGKRKAKERLKNERLIPKQLMTKNAADLGTGHKWWEDKKTDDEFGPGKGQKKWKYLEHNGVIFPPFYEPKGFNLKLGDTKIPLTPMQEELAYFWSQSIGTDWEEREIYRNNFKNLFRRAFRKSEYREMIAQFDKLDFSEIKEYQEDLKVQRKSRTKEEKLRLKQEKEKRDKKYGMALIDGTLEKVGGYVIEPPTTFKGRGLHPKAGCLKARIFPEDVVINCSRDAPVPRCPMPGHCWQDVIHSDTVTWLEYYRDDSINKNMFKYIYLSASSKFKGENDLQKYEKARKLKKYIKKIKKNYREKINSSEMCNFLQISFSYQNEQKKDNLVQRFGSLIS